MIYKCEALHLSFTNRGYLDIMRILLLGGYGATGRQLSSYLLRETDVSIIIAGRSISKAEEFKSELAETFDIQRIFTHQVDASSRKELNTAFSTCDMVIVTATTTKFAIQIAEAALEADIHYLDIYYQQNLYLELKKLHPQIEAKGLSFITQAGFHPGLPAPYIRKGAQYFDEYQSANIYFAMNIEVVKCSSIYEIVDSVGDSQSWIFKNGYWIQESLHSFKHIDFGTDFGTKICVPMYLHELESMPDLFPLNETSIYTAGFNWFTDWFVFPLLSVSQKVKKGALHTFWARLLKFGINNFMNGKKGVVFILQATGIKNGTQTSLTIRSESKDAYLFTTFPIISYIKQFLSGESRKAGLHMMGHIIDIETLFNDLDRFGVDTTIQISSQDS